MPSWIVHYDGTLGIRVDAETEEDAKAITDDISEEVEKMIEAALAHLTNVDAPTFGTVYMIQNKDTGEEVLY